MNEEPKRDLCPRCGRPIGTAADVRANDIARLCMVKYTRCDPGAVRNCQLIERSKMIVSGKKPLAFDVEGGAK